MERTVVRSVREKGQRWQVMRERLGFAMVWRANLQHLRSRCKFTIAKSPSKVLEIGRQRSGMVSGAKPHMAGRMWDLVAQARLRCSRSALRLSWSRLIVDLTRLPVRGASPS